MVRWTVWYGGRRGAGLWRGCGIGGHPARAQGRGGWNGGRDRSITHTTRRACDPVAGARGTAILSVSDKTGLVAFGTALHGLGVEMIASGGSAKTLRDAGLPVKYGRASRKRSENRDYTQLTLRLAAPEAHRRDRQGCGRDHARPRDARRARQDVAPSRARRYAVSRGLLRVCTSRAPGLTRAAGKGRTALSNPTRPDAVTGILARNIPSDDADMAARGYDKLDIVVCNLYPFQKRVEDPATTIDAAVEEVDIGAASPIAHAF